MGGVYLIYHIKAQPLGMFTQSPCGSTETTVVYIRAGYASYSRPPARALALTAPSMDTAGGILCYWRYIYVYIYIYDIWTPHLYSWLSKMHRDHISKADSHNYNPS